VDFFGFIYFLTHKGFPLNKRNNTREPEDEPRREFFKFSVNNLNTQQTSQQDQKYNIPWPSK